MPTAVWTLIIHIRCAFNFLYSNYGELDLLALSDFPRLWLVKIIRSFHDIKLTELSIILFMTSGKTAHIMKAPFHKKVISPFRSSRKSSHIITKLLRTINAAANSWLKGQADSKGDGFSFVRAFVSVLEQTLDYLASITMKHYYTGTITATHEV